MSLQKTFKALADPTRREILLLLEKGDLSAGEIADHFSISAPAVSRHLAILKNADLIRDSRQGKQLIYTLNASVLEEIILWLKHLEGKDTI